jgi:arylsulfatase A-like enzyme
MGNVHPPTQVRARDAARTGPFVTLLGLVLVLACGGERPTRPNVLLISLDTLRADHLGCYGYERETSPFLDRLARESIVYERAFTPAAWTLIAHMTMLTGLFPLQHGVVQDELALSPEFPLLAERLKTAGYQTVGLYHPSWVHERHGFARGFDSFRPHADVEEAGKNLELELARLDDSRPTFLFVHLYDIHNQTLNAGTEVIYPSPAPFQEHFVDERCEPLPKLSAEEIWESNGLLTPGQLRTLVAYYDGGIRHVDARLEQWFARLEEQGFLENALVIVTSDHGEALGERGPLEGHGGFAQEGLHVPLIVRTPERARVGERVDEVVHLGDLVPTVLSVAGLAPDARLPGASLLEALPAQRVLTGSYSFPESGYVLAWPEKLLWREGGKTLAVDLERDPGETQLRKGSEERYRELQRRAYPHDLALPPAIQIAPLSEEERDELRALGYGGE